MHFEALVDDITEICGIHNEIELRKINKWKMRRRRVFAQAWIKPHFNKNAFGRLIFKGYLRLLHTGRKLNHYFNHNRKSKTARNLINKKSNCSGCEACTGVCPMINSQRLEKICKRFFAAKAYDDNLRYTSSSGGIFPVLANYVFDKNGVVFGAAMEERGVVKHIAVDSPADIKKFRVQNMFKVK